MIAVIAVTRGRDPARHEAGVVTAVIRGRDVSSRDCRGQAT